MFKKLSNLTACVDTASKFITLNDRELYRPFLEYIEKFATNTASATDTALFSGQIATELLNDLPVSRDSYQFEVYTTDPAAYARKLADELYAEFKDKSPHIPINTLVVDTVTILETTISINTRVLVRALGFGEYRGVNLMDVVSPVVHKARFADTHFNDIKIMPLDLYLITAYRVLYTPRVDDWMKYYEHITETENKFMNSLDKNNEFKHTEIAGGGNADDFIDMPAAIKSAFNAVKKDNVFIGDVAINVILDNNIGNNSNNNNTTNFKNQRLQIITKHEIKDIIRQLEGMNKDKTRAKYRFDYVKYYLNIPSDFRLLKYTIYISNSKNRFPLIDVFNSASYELIPYTKSYDILVAHPTVVLRFLLIDMWTLRVISRGTLNKKRFDELAANFARISKLPKNFQLENYYGVYLSETVAKKQLMKQHQQPKYYPYLSF